MAKKQNKKQYKKQYTAEQKYKYHDKRKDDYSFTENQRIIRSVG